MWRRKSEPRTQHRDAGDQQPLALRDLMIDARFHPVDRRQNHPDQQAVDAILRVRECRLKVAVRHREAARGEHHRADSAEHADNRPCAQAPAREQQQQRRQHEVKVFFDREAPGLGNRGAQIVLQVGQVLDQEGIPRMAPGQHVKGDQHVIRGPDAENPPDDKALCVDVACFGVLSKQQAAHQKTAQREEQIDAFAPKAFQRVLDNLNQKITGVNGMKVKPHHHDNGNAAHEIQLDGPACRYGSRPAE
ncbi:hypothetical protein KCU90_g2453, partial [Aureobasidium melanogenum]